MSDGLGYVQAAGCECGDGSCGEVGGRPALRGLRWRPGLRCRPASWVDTPSVRPGPEVRAAKLPRGVHRRHGRPLQRLWGELSGSGGRCPVADVRLHPKDAVWRPPWFPHPCRVVRCRRWQGSAWRRSATTSCRSEPDRSGSPPANSNRSHKGAPGARPGPASGTVRPALMVRASHPEESGVGSGPRCGVTVGACGNKCAHGRRDREGTEFRAPSTAVRHSWPSPRPRSRSRRQTGPATAS